MYTRPAVPPSEKSKRPPAPELAGPTRSARWSAGLVNHGDYALLATALDSLADQTVPPSNVQVYDTGIDPEALARLEARFPQVAFEQGPNLGYAGGANRVLAHLGQDPVAPPFVLLLNADVELDVDFAERLIDAMSARPEAAIAGGKLLRPGRQRLDSTGISYPRHRRPRDRGSEQPDAGQFDVSEWVDGVSGAAMWLRQAALSELAIDGEIFDEDFFAYHEDTDLCWRARRLGFSIWYEASAIAVHRRGWRREQRQQIPISVRRHSFKNHYLQIAKNERVRDLVLNAPWLISWEVLRLGFVLLRDRGLFPGYFSAMAHLPAALRKRSRLQARIAAGS